MTYGRIRPGMVNQSRQMYVRRDFAADMGRNNTANNAARLRAEQRRAEEEQIRRDRARQEYEAELRRRAAARARAQHERELAELRAKEKEIKEARRAEEKRLRRRELEARRRLEAEREKKEVKVKKKRLPLGFVVAVATVTIMIMALVYGMSQVSEVTGEISAVNDKLEQLEVKKEELTHDIAMKSDAALIEKRAVEEFLMVQEGTASKKYISLASDDKITLEENESDKAQGSGTLLSAFSSVFGDFAEYFN